MNTGKDMVFAALRPSLCGAAAVLVLSGAPALAGAFAPGQWQHQTTLVEAAIPGIPQWLIRLIASHAGRTSCNSAAQLASHPEALLTADKEAKCELRRLSITDGRLVFDTFCTNHRFPAGLLVASTGTYTATTYQITTTSTGLRDGRPLRIVTKGSGQRVAETCTAP